MTDIQNISDEWLENRENMLNARKKELGSKVYNCSQGIKAKFAKYRKAKAQAEIEILETLGALAEIREIRRTLLGLTFNAHIRKRDTPNFVAKNPDYAKVVSKEVPTCAVYCQETKENPS